MILLKQSSTAQPLVFLLVQSSDHITGLTGATPTVTLSKSGGSFASPSGAVTEIGNGWYKVAGNATDTTTLGPLIVHATATSADPVDLLYEVVAFDPQTVSMGLVLAKTTNLTGLNDVTAATVSTQVWSETTRALTDKAGFTISGTTTTLDALQTALNSAHGSGSWSTATGFSTHAAADIWAVTPRLLTAGTNIVLAKGVGLTGLNDIAATAIVSGGAITTSGGSVSRVTLVDANTDMRGTDNAALAATALSTVVWTNTKAGYIDAAISSAGGSGLDGPSAVTLTFEDADGNPVPLVDFSIVGQGPGRAGTDGVASFGLEDGTYTVIARPVSGTLFASVGLVVDGATEQTITGTAIVIPDADDASQTTAYLYTRDGHGAIEASVRINFQLVSTTGSDSYATAVFAVYSNSGGLLQVALRKSTGYRARRGPDGEWVTFTTDAAGTFALPQILGTP